MLRILIVDDNLSMRKVLAALFTSAGHEVVGAFADGNGIEELIRQTAPDLVCLDYHMPGRDGLTILKVIQAEMPQIDVVFMTASSESDIEEKAADAGASGFIRKPFSQAQIIDELRAVEETRTAVNQAGAVPPGEVRVRRRGTAVIADDNGSVRLVLKGLLEACGLQVVQSVATGGEAILAAKNHQPRILCLDINMPVMGGLEALPQIVEASPQTAVIMVTGCADKMLVAQSAGLGAVGYIIKPLRPAYVENFIRKLLGA
ncbi:response regulator [Dechloromonas denitrificans]|uniref:response regulator n=1 Tax=Dechloromonas denitrificans TaxID=281362 RepID=UPI001CF88B04|nr:response regulator [Dechloromonas denitrificans]